MYHLIVIQKTGKHFINFDHYPAYDEIFRYLAIVPEYIDYRITRNDSIVPNKPFWKKDN